MHVNTYIVLKLPLLYENMMLYNIYIYIYIGETRPYAWKQNIFFMSWRKPGILIPDFYLYSIKIQTDIDQNTVIKLQQNHIFFEIIFEEIN